MLFPTRPKLPYARRRGTALAVDSFNLAEGGYQACRQLIVDFVNQRGLAVVLTEFRCSAFAHTAAMATSTRPTPTGITCILRKFREARVDDSALDG